MTDAATLAAAFKGEGPLASLASPPQNTDSAYQLQDEVRDALGEFVIGWKLAATVPPAQAAQGVDQPTVSPLLNGMIVPNETVFAEKRFYKPEAEAEIVIELGDELTGPASADEVREASAGFRLAIEMADTRYIDKPRMGPLAVIADLNSSSALVIGELQPLSGAAGAAMAPINLRLGDGTLVEALSADWRPDPFEVVSFLTRFLEGRGHALPKGTMITTGTHTKPTPTGAGVVSAEFVGIGKVSCRLSEPWSR